LTHLLRNEVAARRKSESMLSSILDAVPYCIWWKDPRGVFLGCNQPFIDAAGLHTPADVIGKTDFDLPWPRKDAEAYRADDQEVLATNRPKRHIVEPIKHVGGSRRLADTTKVPLVGPDGTSYGVLGVAEDITDRKEAEEALRRERAFIDAMLLGLPGVVCLYDDQLRLIKWNRKVTEVSGYTDAELAGRHALDWFPEDHKDRVAAAVRDVMEGRHVEIEADGIMKDGRRVPYYNSGVRLMIEGRPYLLSIGIDITARRAAEDALQHEKALIDAIFDNIPALLALHDDAGRLVRWNRKTNEITGFSDAELVAMVVGDRQPPEERERILAGVRLAMREGIQNSQEATLLTKAGDRIPFYFTGVRVTFEGKAHLLAIGVDIRDRKLAEEQLRHALEQAESANRAKDQFLAAVSHELRTPLAPVLFLASSLEADPRLPPDVHCDLTDIREHAEIEKRLISDLLDFSAIHAGKLQIRPVPTDLHDVLRAAVRTCQETIGRKRLRLDVRLDAHHHLTHGDPDRLRQVFWNLLQNACKFSPDDCALSVRTSDDDIAAGPTLRVEVADAGIGMTPETLQRVFRPFEQGPRDERARHAGGLGLGLAIAKSIVEAHGGSITAASEGPGHGSTFAVRLPVTAKAPPVTLPITPNLSPAELPPLRLLLVEDDPLTLKLLGRLLAAEGHNVTTAATIDAALRAADQRPFDLVLSDLTLPDGSGLDLMPLLRARHHLPGIALSGYGSYTDVEASRRAGFLIHLTKPVTPDSLRAALAQISAAPRIARD
jgi:two-component system CheB/CheR fusion protein